MPRARAAPVPGPRRRRTPRAAAPARSRPPPPPARPTARAARRRSSGARRTARRRPRGSRPRSARPGRAARARAAWPRLPTSRRERRDDLVGRLLAGVVLREVLPQLGQVRVVGRVRAVLDDLLGPARRVAHPGRGQRLRDLVLGRGVGRHLVLVRLCSLRAAVAGVVGVVLVGGGPVGRVVGGRRRRDLVLDRGRRRGAGGRRRRAAAGHQPDGQQGGTAGGGQVGERAGHGEILPGNRRNGVGHCPYCPRGGRVPRHERRRDGYQAARSVLLFEGPRPTARADDRGETRMPRSCGSVQNYFRQVDFFPDLRRNQAVLEGMTRASARQGAQAPRRLPAEIPVVVHLVHGTDADNLSDAQVASQIEVLNEDYAAANKDLENVPGAFTGVVGNPGLRFALATTDPSGAPTGGITRRRTTVGSFGVDDKVKAAATGGTDAWDTVRYLNIWVCRIDGGVLGYAQFPGGPPETDGVVIMTTAFGRGGSAKAPFDLGRTAVHEVGHYLNLSHIWGEARVPTCTDSDFVDDTPNQWGPNFSKPTFPTASCGNTPDGDMFMNYMDYVDDDTMVMFTDEQVARMHAALEFSRPELGQDADATARRAPAQRCSAPRHR